MEESSVRGGEVASVGDFVHPGSFRLHSRFTRVVNFSAADHLISLVDEEVGGGPSHIVLKNIDLGKAGETLNVTFSEVETGEIRLSLPDNSFRSSVSGRAVTREAVREVWSRVRKNVLLQASCRSAVFALEDRSSSSSDGAFESAMRERIRAGVECLRSGEWLEGARLLRGVGFGLTPTGDDLLAGFLTGLNLVDAPRDRIEEIYAAALGENAISNSQLFFGKEGRLFEGTRRLLSAVERCMAGEIPGAVTLLLSRGSTSGADFSVGLILAVEPSLKGEE